MEIEKRKLKARLRDERCANCKYRRNNALRALGLSNLKTDSHDIKPRVYCERHKHLKKFDSWCKYYIKE
jgi:hypothetical protein